MKNRYEESLVVLFGMFSTTNPLSVHEVYVQMGEAAFGLIFYGGQTLSKTTDNAVADGILCEVSSPKRGYLLTDHGCRWIESLTRD